MIRAITNDAVAITPHDTNALDYPGVVYVGTGGNVKVKTIEGNDVTFNNCPDGYEIKCMVTMVYDTGTTASNLVLYRDKP